MKKKKKKRKKEKEQKKKKREAYNTRGSQAVTHPSTKRARRCLTSVIGREPVYSAWYGRRHLVNYNICLFKSVEVHILCSVSYIYGSNCDGSCIECWWV